MSFTESLQKVVYTYIDTISKKYNLNVSELRELWNGKLSLPSVLQPSIFSSVTPVKTTLVTPLPTVDMSDLSPARLNGCTKTELAALCRSKGLKVGGNKPELIERLLQTTGQSNGQSTLPFAKPAEKKAENKAEKKIQKSDRAEVAASIVKKLKTEIRPVPVKSNKFGNFEHPESGLVVDRHTQLVYGKQLDDGTVADLTPEDIQTAKMLGLPYSIPKNLDAKVDLDSVKVEDVDSESDIELDKNKEDNEEEEEDEEELPEEEDEEELAEED